MGEMYDKEFNKLLDKCYKPYDVVDDGKCSVGFIQEVQINDCQNGFDDMVSYSVVWFYGPNTTAAWFSHDSLTRHCNLFEEIAKCSCHPFGRNKRYVEQLMNLSGKRKGAD